MNARTLLEAEEHEHEAQLEFFKKRAETAEEDRAFLRSQVLEVEDVAEDQRFRLVDILLREATMLEAEAVRPILRPCPSFSPLLSSPCESRTHFSLRC